ncbi:MAG: branched-chain amino acid ABC transporter permease [Methylobacteriaceae bacterium]|jgi:branched-chain amino acid transport system permease protein|nr:branched-chain amino acid ABC transporter permease [Methylobacteriaceae bacterium]
MKKYTLNIVFVLLCAGVVLASQYKLLDRYILTVLMLMGINIIFATSLNLVNGNMREFSCGHAGFACVGAYVGSVLSVLLFTANKYTGQPLLSPSLAPLLFPVIMLAAALVSAVFGLLVALPSFKTRDDYLAIITIAANFIIISIIENSEQIAEQIFGAKSFGTFINGSRGFSGMKRTVNAMNDVAHIPWMEIWVILGACFCVFVLYRLVTSTYGKGIDAVAQDEIAAEIMSVDTKRTKLIAFMVSSGLAGISGVLYAHIYGYVNASSFGILRSTEALVMVYLGGMGSLSGCIMAAIAFTVLVEALRPGLRFLNDNMHYLGMLPDGYEISEVWRWVIIPLILFLLMQFRPEGLLGNRELTHVFPKLKNWFTLR